jgi:hypothetical protein
MEALQKRAWGIPEQERLSGLWRVRRENVLGKDGRGARRLGRCCEVPDRDLFSCDFDERVHLNAWSSRK